MAITLTTAPSLTESFAPTEIRTYDDDFPDYALMPSQGIPQSFDPPDMTEAFGENPWDVDAREESARRDEMLSGALAKIDKAALDPDSYFKGQDMSLSLNPIVDQRAATVDAFLRLQNGGEPFDTSPNPLANDLTRATIRQRVAHSLFDGRGADDDDAFFSEIRKSAENRVNRRKLGTTLATKAHTAALISLTDPGKESEFSWPAFREEARKAPGYTPDDEASLYEAYHASRAESQAALASFAPELQNVWSAMKTGPAGNFSQVAQAVIGDMLGQNPDKPMGAGREELAKKDAPRLALDAYYQLTEDERPQFMHALATLARTLPKEQQAAFFTNLAKQGGRDIDDLTRNIASMPGEIGKVEGIGAEAGRQAAIESTAFFQGGDAVGKITTKEQLLEKQNTLLAARNFASDVRNIERQDYNPVKSAWGDEKMGILETGLYGVPGALASSALVAIPYIGPVAMFSSMEGAAYDDIRRNLMASGMSDADATARASEWATAVAVPQTALEKLQAAALVGKLPFLDRFFTSIGDKFTSNATRFAFRTTTGAVQETAIEAAQDFVPHIAQELAATLSEEIPHVTWSNGKDGALDGFWTQQATTFITMLPLAIIGAAGGITADKRVNAFQNASDNTLLALGASREQLAELRAAQAKGIETVRRTLPKILDNLDPTTDTAKQAVEALVKEELEKQGVAAESTASGILPRFTRTAEGWTLHDSETGAEIGTAPNAEAALRLAITHTDSIDEADANRFAYMATMLEAGDFSALTETFTRQTTTDFRPGETVTAAQQAAISPGDAARVADQIRLREKTEGGTGEIAGIVLGQSSTTFENNQRRTVNRLNAGASVLTVFHEETHGFYREAIATGRLTRNDSLSVIRALDTILAKKTTKEGQPVRFLPADFDTLTSQQQETAIDEAVSELMESEVIRTRKGTGVRKIPAGIISRNLAAITRIAGGAATNKFRAFARALRSYFGIAIDRAAHLDRAIKDGTINQSLYNEFLTRLLGQEEQAALDQKARDYEAEITEGTATPEAIPDGDPFSIGRTTVTPTASTRTFQGQDGQTVIGPASFAIGAFHGTPHKVDKFTTAKIGTGEGAQAYGWGLYFADSEEVARNYKETLPEKWYVVQEDDGSYTVEPYTLAIHNRALGNRKISGIKTLNEAEFIASQKTQTGNLYRVSLKVEEEDLLDYDGEMTDEQAAKVAPLFKGNGTSRKVSFLYKELSGGAGESYGGGSPELASSLLASVGIRGLKFLDGNSRSDGQGSYNYVIFNEADIEILEENGQPVSPPITDHRSPGTSLSLGPAALADAMRQGAIARIRDPQRRVRAMSAVARKMEQIHLVKARLELIHGSKRAKASLRKEAAFREATLAEQYENEAYARHYGILDDDDLRKIKSQPVHSFLSDPESPLHGVLMSKSKAIKLHPDLFQLHRAGDYDGSDGVSRSVFGGNRMPDQAAQDLYDANLIKEPTADALWQALLKEQAMVSTMKELHAAAKEDIRSARTRAKQETNEWLAREDRTQESKFSPKQEVLSALALLDAILSSVSPEIRGKVGGYTQLAKLGSDEHRLTYLTNRLERVDKLLEEELRSEFGKEMNDLLKRARPQRDAPGEKPKGTAGSDVHSLFAELERYMSLPMLEVEARAVGLESQVASGELTPEAESHATILANLLRLAGDWTKADAARREAAVTEATRIFAKGYLEHRVIVSAIRERRQKQRAATRLQTGKQGNPETNKQNRRKEGESVGKVAKSSTGNYFSFSQILGTLTGDNSETMIRFGDWERRASDAKADALEVKTSALESLLADLGKGGSWAASETRRELQKPNTITIQAKHGEIGLSQMEAVGATLMWMQEDGRRHMEGHLDDAGNPVGKWHYSQADMDAIESQLTDEAKAVRVHLQEQYAGEYDRLNPVYRDQNGVNLPRNKFYSPLTVKPQSVSAGQEVDPVTGFAMASGSFSPGSLKNRSQTAVAEPDFRDALATYIGHTTQIEHYIAYAAFNAEAAAVFRDRDTRAAMEERGGAEALNTLDFWLEYFGMGGIRQAGAHLATNRILSGIASNATSMALIGRITVPMVQSVQLLASWSQMSTASYMKRIGKLFTFQLDYGAALQSPYMRRRLNDAPPAVRDAMNALLTSARGTLEDTAPGALFHKTLRLFRHTVAQSGRVIPLADWVFTSASYAIIHDKEMTGLRRDNPNLAEEELHRLATANTERTMDIYIAQPMRPGARSAVELQGQTGATRLIYNFISDPRQKIGGTIYKAREAAGGDKRARLAAARMAFVHWIAVGTALALLRAAMLDARRDEDDDEWIWDAKRLGLDVALGPLQIIPFLGEEVSAAIQTGFGERPFTGTLLSSLSRTPGAAEGILELFQGESDTEAALQDIETLLNGTGLFSRTSSAATSVAHVIRDLFNIARQAVK